MARLTRTQKYADLRNQLENGREVEIQKENVSKIEDNQEDLIAPEIEEVIKSLNNDIKPVEEVKNPSTNDLKAEDLKEDNDNNFETLVLDDLMETPSVEETKDDNFETLNLDDLMMTPSTETKDDDFEPIEVAKEEPKIDHPIVIEDEPVEQKQPVEKITPEKTPTEELVVEPIEIKEVPVEEEVHEEIEEIKVQPEIADITDNYLKECLNEVNEYNKSKGLMTDDEIPATIISEIRGETTPDTTQKTVAEPENSSIDDLKEELVKEDNFTNTVTLEIQKILSELEEIDDEESTEEVKEPVEEKLVQAQVDPAETIVEPVKPIEPEETSEAEVESILKSYLGDEDENSDLAKTMTVGKVEEVPAAKVEDSSTIQATLLSDQLPLDVTKDTQSIKADEEDEEDEEEIEGPNRILNFILIALIVVLLVILGFIGYMILVAQGII